MYYSKRLKLEKRPIYLVGFMASGKTTLAREWATLSGRSFLDLDQLIERSEQQSIAQIFEAFGQEYFRFLEASALRLHQADILSTGGGTPCFYGGMEYMNRVGRTVFLNTALETIRKRIERNTVRPLAGGQNLSQLYDSRLEIYSKAMYTINPTGDLANDIQELEHLLG